MPQTFQLRRGTTGEWSFANPILQAGEMGYETSTNRIKVGTGVDPWSSLLYVESSADSVDWSNVDNRPTAFPPTSHASSHETGGTDALTPASIGAAPTASPTFTGVVNVAAGSAAAPAIVASGDSNTGIAFDTDTLIFSTDGNERLRITSAGKVTIGSGEDATAGVRIGTSLSGGTGVNGLIYATTVASSVTAAANVFRTFVGTQADAFTLPFLAHYRSSANTFGAGSTVTTQIGFHADSTLTGANTNYGFRSDVADGSGRYNFYALGTAPNYFAGNVGIATTEPSGKLDINSDKIRLRIAKTPASSSDTGNAGDICWDSSYLYICTAPDTWRRIAHSTW
jgi:hypothetical protein